MNRLAHLIVAALAILTLTSTPAFAAGPQPSDWQSNAQQLFEDSKVPGMVAVVVNGDQIVWSGGLGQDSEGRAMTEQSPVQVASITKSFTAAAVIELTQERGIDLDDPVRRWLPDFVMDDPRSSQITVRQLLNHTSGLTDAGTHYYRTMNSGAQSPRDHVAALAGQGLTNVPGARFTYANINYVTLGRLVEVVSGTPLAEQLDQRVLHPHGLADTRLAGDSAPAGSNSLYGRWVPHTDTSNPMVADPAGGLVTTATDLGQWLIANNGRGGRPLDAATREAMVTTSPASRGYGAGWEQDDRTGWWGHTGNRYTYSGYMMRNPHTGWGVAVVVNGASMSDPAYAIAQNLAALTPDPANAVAEAEAVPDALSTDRLALGVSVVIVLVTALLLWRARAWAERRHRQPIRATLGLLWPTLLVIATALTPLGAGNLVGGIDMEWSMLAYYFLTPLVTALLLGASAAVVLLTRGWSLWREVRTA